MRDFEFKSARTVDEAVALMAEKGGQARALAGGTDLLVQLRVGRRSAELVVDVKDIPDANALDYNPESGLTVGAATPCYRIYQDDTVNRLYPGLIDAAAMIGGIQIQGRASIGGNLCNAAPSADGIPPLIMLGAVAVVVGPNGTREIAVEDFCTAPGQNTLNDGEILVSIKMPTPAGNAGAHYLRFIPRNEMDIAIAGVGSSVVLDSDKKTITSARVALASVAPTPLFVKEAGDALVGKEASDASFEAAAEAAMEAAKPINDMRGTIKQRKHLVGVLTRRTLRGAVDRAKEA